MAPQHARTQWVLARLQIILVGALFLVIDGCQEAEPQIGPPLPAVKNPYPENDPIERRIAALRTMPCGAWYTWADYFAVPGYYHLGWESLNQSATSAPVVMLKPLIAMGPTALPHLIAHLSDSQKTGLSIEHNGMFDGMFWEGRYDSRTGEEPERLGERDGSVHLPQRHVITVGDLCFFAIGEIVDRNFDPACAIPTLCISINSPTSIPALAARVAKDWSGLTPEAHRDSLLADFRDGRRQAAMQRLAFYYPAVAEPIAIDELKRPIFSRSLVDSFASELLYTTNDQKLWDERFSAFVAQNGPAFREGLLAQLLSDSREFEDQPGESREPIAGKVLARLFPDVNPAAMPTAAEARAAADQADLIRGLSSLRSSRIDAEVYHIFHNLSMARSKRYDEDSLAIACIERLIGKGHDAEIAAYCAAHARPEYGDDDEFRQVLHYLRRK